MYRDRIVVVLIACCCFTANMCRAQPRDIEVKTGVETLEPLPVGFWGKMERGFLPVEDNKKSGFGVQIFEIQVTGPFHHDKIDYTARVVAGRLDSTLTDQRAIPTTTDENHHTVIGCKNIKTQEVSWLAISAKGKTQSWVMRSGKDNRTFINEAWVYQEVNLGTNMHLILSGADDDAGHVVVGWRWDDAGRDWGAFK